MGSQGVEVGVVVVVVEVMDTVAQHMMGSDG